MGAKSNSLPKLTAEQRAAALAKGQAARKARADFKAAVASGELTVGQALALERRKDPVLGRTRVVDLVKSVPGFGVNKAGKVMEKLAISPTRRLRGLSDRQAAELAALLD